MAAPESCYKNARRKKIAFCLLNTQVIYTFVCHTYLLVTLDFSHWSTVLFKQWVSATRKNAFLFGALLFLISFDKFFVQHIAAVTCDEQGPTFSVWLPDPRHLSKDNLRDMLDRMDELGKDLQELTAVSKLL
tara:strand:+ start:1996 stop:2391 length:396 start_codon:yes stop_codon:yes gene_type:complete